MESKLVCPCGLTCCDCLFYKSEIYEAARMLKEMIKRHHLDQFLLGCSKESSWTRMGEHLGLDKDQIWNNLGEKFDVFKQMPDFMKVLDGIINLQCKNTCQEVGGCSANGQRHECNALKCIKSKGYDGCWQCSEFKECDKLSFLRTSYGSTIEENLKLVREKGMEAVESRGNRYYEWQRKLGLS